MAVKGWIRRKKPLLLTGAFSLGMAALTAYSYVTYAWFAANRAATVNFASLTVEGGLEAKVRYFRQNKTVQGSTAYYQGYGVKGLDLTGFSYSGDFLDPGADPAPFAMAGFAPGKAMSYCVEIANPTSQPIDAGFYLTSYRATASSTAHHVAETVGGMTYGPEDAFNLTEATRVYSAFATADPTGAGASFLQKSFLDSQTDPLQSDDVGNRFVGHAETGSPVNLTPPDNWMPGGKGTIPSQGTGYLFLTFYFSDDSSTYYHRSTHDYGDGKTHYAKTLGPETLPEASSQAYAGANGLPDISFPALLVSPL